jgi:hypothetical protein
MATFQAQVEGLTSLSIGTSPSTAELTQYLKDGVIDVTNKSIAMNPSNIKLFTRVSTIKTSNPLDINGAKVVSVVREAGVDNDWRNCKEVPSHLQSRVTDIGSLHFASKFNPVYTILENGNINVYPEPGADPNSFKVYYVNNVPEDKGGDALLHSHSDIKYFDDSKVYLVVIYAAIKSLENHLGSLNAAPTVGGASEELTGTMDSDSAGYGTDADFDDFSKWFTTAGEFIEDEEDEELASMQIQKINSYVQAFQAQNQANVSAHSHLQLRHALLSRQYESAFGMKPKE